MKWSWPAWWLGIAAGSFLNAFLWNQPGWFVVAALALCAFYLTEKGSK